MSGPGSLARKLRHGLALGSLVPTYVALGALKHVLPVERLARWAWRAPAPSSDEAHVQSRVGLILRLSRLAGPADRDCLQRSLLLYRELSKGGADPVLVMGFRKDGGRLEGHAWVESRGRVVGDSAGEVGRYAGTLRCGRGGTISAVSPSPSPR